MKSQTAFCFVKITKQKTKICASCIKNFIFLVEILKKTLYNIEKPKKERGEKMNSELVSFVNEVSIKTGISFSVYTYKGDFVAGEQLDCPVNFEQIDEIVVDYKNNCTAFPILFKGKSFNCVLKGNTIVEKNYAILISQLAENYFSKEYGLSEEDFFKALLFGEINPSQINKYMHKYALKDLPCFVMLINTPLSQAKECENFLTNCVETFDFFVRISQEQIAFVKFIEDQMNEGQSSTEYAEFIRQSLYEEMGVKVKIAVGGVVNAVSELNVSFLQAETTFRMNGVLGSKGDIHSFKEYVLIKMLEELPKHKLSENLQTLMDAGAKEIFSDDEMLMTAEEFLENSLNTSETSRKLYLHRNTLIYRLDKIEKATGLNIRKFSDAITFRLITILSRLVK